MLLGRRPSMRDMLRSCHLPRSLPFCHFSRDRSRRSLQFIRCSQVLGLPYLFTPRFPRSNCYEYGGSRTVLLPVRAASDANSSSTVPIPDGRPDDLPGDRPDGRRADVRDADCYGAVRGAVPGRD